VIDSRERLRNGIAVEVFARYQCLCDVNGGGLARPPTVTGCRREDVAGVQWPRRCYSMEPGAPIPNRLLDRQQRFLEVESLPFDDRSAGKLLDDSRLTISLGHNRPNDLLIAAIAPLIT